MKDEKGNQTQLVNSPVGTAFGMPALELAISEGQWRDADLRSWQPGYGEVVSFNWSA